MEIKGIWINNTDQPLTVVVNGDQYSGIIEAGGHSHLMTMALDRHLMLGLQIMKEESMNTPTLLWENTDGRPDHILQQQQLNGDWGRVPVAPTLLPEFYRFHLGESTDGLLIVGTVELVKGEVQSAAH